MLSYLKKEKTRNFFLIALISSQSFLKTSAALTLTASLDALISWQLNEFLFWLLINMCIWILWLWIRYATNLYQEKTILKMSMDFRNQVAEYLYQTSYFEFHKREEGIYVSWLCTDAKLVEDMAFRPFYQIVEAITTVLFSIVGLLSYHYSIVVLTLFLSVLIVGIPGLKPLRKYVQDAFLAFSEENETFSARVTDLLYGFNEFFSYNIQNQIQEKICQYTNKLQRAALHNTKKQNIVSSVILAINVISQLLINLCTGLLILSGAISAGALLTTGQLSGNVFNALGNISGYFTSIHSAAPIFKKIPIVNITNRSGASIGEINKICFRGVNFDYGNGFIFKHNVSMTFLSGEKYIIVGESGSGKSTLMNILTGKISGYSGSIRINGQELKDISGYCLRNHVILMNQQSYFFNTTIRENILMGKVVEERVLQKIIFDSGLISFLSSLPEGLDTVVTGNGLNFSGGQRQRIALARVLASGRKFIIIDEGTNALNSECALNIERQLFTMQELTIIMITHNFQKELKPYLTEIIQI